MRNVHFFSIRNKLVMICVALILITSLTISVSFYRASETTIQSQTESLISVTLQQTVSRFDMFMENIHRATLSIAFNRDLKKLLNDSGWEDSEQYNNLLRITDLISTFNNTNRFVYMVEIYDLRSHTLITSRGGIRTIDSTSSEYALIERLYINQDGAIPPNYWTPSRTIQFSGVNKKVFSFSIPIRDEYSGNVIAVVMTYVPDEYITQLCKEVSAMSGEAYILDESRNIVFSSDPALIGKQTDIPGNGSGMEKLTGREYLYTVGNSKYMDWSMISVVPIKALMANNTSVLKSNLIFISIITILLAVVLSIVMHSFFYKPIHNLIRQIKLRNHEKSSEKQLLSRKDEIGFLFRNFTNILDDNRKLIESNYKQKIYVRDAEIRLLFSQINPHFLYNSLDSIIWMISFERYNEAKTMVKAMIKFFRLSLNKGQEMTLVNQVKEQIENYFVIQQLRYSDRLTVEIDIQESILERKMLNFLLQPVVENAVSHGIEKKPGEAKIRIGGWEEDGSLHFLVEDNGVGVSPERLEEVNRIIHAEELPSENFYALQNINRRIGLNYGQSYGIRLESTEGQGMQVHVTVPVLS